MAKFVYRMENILTLKTKLESEAKIQLAIANNILRQEQEKLEEIYIETDAYRDKIRGYANEALDVLELKRCNDAIAVKTMEAEEQKNVIVRAEKNVELAMTKVREIMLERKTQEKLKEKAFETFKQELNAEESKETDEVVSYQYNGKNEEGDI